MCGEGYTRHVDVDAEVCRLVVERLEALRDLLSRARPVRRQRATEDVTKAIVAAKARRARAVSLAVDGAMTREDLRERLASIDDDIARLEARQREHEQREQMRGPAKRADALRVVETVREAWRRLPVPKRRAILVALAESVRLVGGRPEVTWRAEEALAATAAGNLFGGAVARRRLVRRLKGSS